MGQREEIIAHYRRSRWSWSFWWRTLVTLGLYLLLWNRNKITLTNRRLIERRGGIIGGEEVSVNLNRITDIRVKTSAIGSILGFGLFEVQSAGSDNAEITFSSLGKPHKLKDQIIDLQHDGKIDGGPIDKTKSPEDE